MNYRNLISEAWSQTQREKGLIMWFGFLPSLLTTTVGIFYVLYQFFAFKKSHFFDDADTSFLIDIINFSLDFVHKHVSMTLPLVVVVIFFGIIWFLYPTLARAGAIQAIARRKNNQKSSAGIGLKYGIPHYLPLLEFSMLRNSFSLVALLGEIAFVMRNMEGALYQIFLPIMIFVLVIGVILSLLFIYTDFFIVIDNEPIFSSMLKSAGLVFMNLKHTFLITILMFLIGIRVVIQAIVVFLIPILIILLTAYIASVTLPITGFIVGGVVGFFFLIISAYLNGIVEIFSFTVWTYTFLDLTTNQESSAREVL